MYPMKTMRPATITTRVMKVQRMATHHIKGFVRRSGPKTGFVIGRTYYEDEDEEEEVKKYLYMFALVYELSFVITLVADMTIRSS